MRSMLFAVAMMMVSGCATIEPGTVLVQVDVCSRANNYKVVHSGRVWDGPCTDFYHVPVREQRAVWTAVEGEGDLMNDESITFAGRDGQPVNVDIALAYQIDSTSDDRIIRMIQTYGPSVGTTVDSRVRDYVRDSLNICASSMTVQDIYGERRSELHDCAEQRVKEEFAPNGLVINRLTFNSEIRLPQSIREAMERSQTASADAERARREVEVALAKGQQLKAEAEAEFEARLIRAKAEAESNRIVAEGITPEILELRRLEIERARVERWNGTVPSMVMGSESSPLFMVQK